MRPRPEIRGVVLLIGGLLLALAAILRSRREESSRVTLGAVAGVALALIGLRRILRSRRSWQSDFDARHASRWADDFGFGGLGRGVFGRRSVRTQAERAARDVRRQVHRTVNRVFG